MVYCSKCGNENQDDAEYCTKCGASLTSTKKEYEKTQAKTSSFLEKQVEDFAEEVGQIGKKAGKIIEQGAKNIGEEVKDIGKRVEKEIKSGSSSYVESREYKRLYRSGKNRVLGGVCGGVAEHFKIDPTLIRILWAIIVFFPPGLGIIMYILFWIFVPRNPNHNWN
jgi:phage shock protein C